MVKAVVTVDVPAVRFAHFLPSTKKDFAHPRCSSSLRLAGPAIINQPTAITGERFRIYVSRFLAVTCKKSKQAPSANLQLLNINNVISNLEAFTTNNVSNRLLLLFYHNLFIIIHPNHLLYSILSSK
jgi:hypothetical protein